MPIKSILLFAAGIILLLGLFTVGFPFLLALIIAILIEPLVLWLERTVFRGRRMPSTIVVCTLIIIAIAAILYFIAVKVYVELMGLLTKFPAIITEVDTFFKKTMTEQSALYSVFPDEWVPYIQQHLVGSIDTLTDALTSLISNATVIVFDAAKMIPELLVFFIVFVVALFLISFTLGDLKKSILGLFAQESRDKIETVLNHLRDAVSGFLGAQIVISFLTYIVALLGLLIIGTPFPLAIALLIIVVDLLPILGTGSVLVPWAIYNVLAGDIKTAVGLVLLFLVITIFRRIVEPKILGNAIGISALAALVSLYVGFKLIGLVGLFIGPIVVIFYTALKKAGLMNIKIKI